MCAIERKRIPALRENCPSSYINTENQAELYSIAHQHTLWRKEVGFVIMQNFKPLG
jgi:hypothetical protein